MTNLTQANNVIDVVKEVNNFTGQWLFNGISLALFLILFIAFRKTGFKSAFGTASFITAFLSIFLRTLNLISDLVFWAWVIIGLIGFVFIILDRD